MRIVFAKTTTLLQLDTPVIVKRFNKGPLEATQVQFEEYSDGEVRVSFGGTILTQSGEPHAGARFGFHICEEYEDEKALQWLAAMRENRS